MSAKPLPFKGEDYDPAKPIEWTTDQEYRNGMTIPAGSKIKQFSTQHFGWTFVQFEDGRPELGIKQPLKR
jgi:hypothetical protein